MLQCCFVCRRESGTSWPVHLLYAAGFWYELQAVLLEVVFQAKHLLEASSLSEYLAPSQAIDAAQPCRPSLSSRAQIRNALPQDHHCRLVTQLDAAHPGPELPPAQWEQDSVADLAQFGARQSFDTGTSLW